MYRLVKMIFAILRFLIEAVEAYYQYVISLQKEYRELFEFCFVDDFYNGILGDLRAIERYDIYRKIHHQPDAIGRREHYYYGYLMREKDEPTLGISQEKLDERYKKWLDNSEEC